MKPATNTVAGFCVDLHRRADLLGAAGVHHDHPLRERHRLDLVVRDVQARRAQAPVQLLDLDAHLHAQLRVEVRQRLVEQEHRGLAHDRAAHRDALALAARELRAACARGNGSSSRISAARLHARVDVGLGGSRGSSGRRPCCSNTLMCG